MKKLVSAILIACIAISTVACGASVSTEKSLTGKISVKVVGSDVTLNNCSYSFPKDFSIEEGKIEDPIGISYAQLSNNGELIGVFADGFYSENITDDNLFDAVNSVYTTIHSVNDGLELSDDMFVESDYNALVGK